MNVNRYKQLVNDAAYHLPVSSTSRYAMFLGNARQFWSPLCRWLDDQCIGEIKQDHIIHWHLAEHHPVDTYVQQVLNKALIVSNISFLSSSNQQVVEESSIKPFGVSDIRYAHETEQGCLLPIQTVAHAAELGYYLKNIGLCNHPVHG
jgi:hypothetical protein